ncbi:RNA polymerase sigma-70 factor, ECF subfamily [Chitinophaga rupis]|uniref:RNA polymerase sigma-70 factor, ECF subfamily n=1 Tax=Chitinophaga rupis TaxID=573321 RepID=A0A1H7XXZ6_9BACT|nr:sigma-70 family RNA polymerase sigma factor [Chitinophaga rupis]SEM38826.1 RNA polymerase sigma-70 factor, ECF subfamily [Chitinophaga rupis]
MQSINEDIILLQRLKEGDEQALQECFYKYRQQLVTLAFAILRNEEEARDLVQDLFMDFWEKQRFLNIKQSLSSFLFISTKNRCLLKIEKDKTRRKHFEQMIVPDSILPISPMEEAEIEQELKRRYFELSQVMEKLSPQTSRVLKLAVLEGKKYKDIATELGTSPNTVRNQIVSALKILRSNLKQQ